MSFADITNILDENHASFVILLCHHNADPDAICSAYAFQSLLTKRRPNMRVEIGTGQGISRLSKHILKHISIIVKLQPDVEKADVIVLLDTNTIQQLGQLAERVSKTAVPIIVIDHHAVHPQTEQIAKLCITNEEASSTCEMVYGFYQELNMKPDLDVAKALFLEASAARALVDLGAHMAAVAGQKNEKIEISMRCTRDFNIATGIHLGRDIAKPLGEYLQGMGGGHATAAGVNGTGYIEKGLKRCLRLVKEQMSN